MLAYFEEETNRSEDLALTYLQNRAPSTPIPFFVFTRINLSFTRYQRIRTPNPHLFETDLRVVYGLVHTNYPGKKYAVSKISLGKKTSLNWLNPAIN